MIQQALHDDVVAPAQCTEHHKRQSTEVAGVTMAWRIPHLTMGTEQLLVLHQPTNWLQHVTCTRITET